MLYLVDTNKDFIKGFLVYDPFNNVGPLRYIDLPVEQDFSPKDLIFFGVFRGRLRMIQLTHDRDHPAFSGNGKFDPRRYCFSVWELEDYANAADAAAVGGYMHGASNTKFTSPTYYTVSCNMHTRDLNMAGQIQDEMDDFSNVRPIFLLGQPSWPTPLPPRPLESE
nr:hypothetical protein CFP56_25473 [Quercus suber]